MKLAYFDAHKEDQAALEGALSDWDVVTYEESLNDKTVDNIDDVGEVEVVSVFVDSDVTADVIEKMPKLKMIAVRSAGFDHVDLSVCEDKGITVCNVPHYGENTVAEHTFALMLALSRKIFQSYERTEKMDFDRSGLTGFDLEGKTLGVIGTGNIGQKVIARAKAFNMHVVAYDVAPDDELASDLGFKYLETVEEVLKSSDVVTLHVPYLKETHHIINKDNLQKIKPGALLINTARGGLIDTEALLAALKEGALSGAGLDVLEEEHDAFDRIDFLSKNPDDMDDLKTLLRNHLLVSRSDVIITPHNAFNSQEAVKRIFDTTVANMESFVSGSVQNEV